MNNYELLIGIAIFSVGFYALVRDFKLFIYILLFSSVLIHKEMFSLYMWDFMPIRFLMLALSFYVVGAFFLALFTALRERNMHQRLELTKISQYLRDPFIISLTLLWLVRGFSLVFSKDIRSSVELYAFFTSIYLASLFIYIRLKSRPLHVILYLDFYIAIVFALCMFGFLQLFLSSNYNFTIGAFWQIPGHSPRVGSLFWDVNHFGAFIASLFLYGCARFLAVSGLKRKILYGILLLPIPIILYLTNSRSSLLLLISASALFGFIVLFKKIGNKAFGLTALVALFAFLTFFYTYSDENSKVSKVIRSNLHYRIDSFDSHFLLLSGASEVFTENPILGGGYGSFYAQFMETSISSEYLRRDPAGLLTKVPAHTIWGEVASETGMLGFSAFLFLCLIITAVPFYNFLVSNSYKDYLVHGAIFSSIIGYFVAGIFYSYNSEFFWLVLILYTTYGIAKLIQNMPVVINNPNPSFTFGLLKKAVMFIEVKINAGFILLGLLTFSLIFINLGKNTLITWDEAIYGKIAKNIVQTGEWLTLQWKVGSTWFEKPPLYFWSTAFFMKIFGINEFAVRLTSALSGFGSIMVLTYFAKKIYGRSVGYLAGFILLTTFQFLYYARTGMLDVTLTFFITTALVIYFLGAKMLRTFVLAGVFVGLAVLTKGVVGFLPLLIILIFELVMLPKTKKLSELVNVFYIFVFSAIVFMPWHAYMLGLYGNKFYDNYIVYHVLQRASTAIEGKGQPFWWYFVVMKVSMRLWFLALLVALPFTTTCVLFRKKMEKFNFLFSNNEIRGLIFTLVWFIVVALFFSSAISKLIWYIIPIYVPAALICAFTIVVILRNFFSKFAKNIVDEMVFVTIFFIFMFTFTYFYVEKGRVYTSDLNYAQAFVLKQSSVKYPNETVLVDRIESPVTFYYRDGPYAEVDFQQIRASLSKSSEKPTIFITNKKRFVQLEKEFLGLSNVDQAGDFILAYYLKQ